MSIDTQAAIIIGLPHGEIKYDEDKFDDLYDFLEDNDMEVCAPSYDGGDADDAIAGFIYKCTSSYRSLDLKWDQDIVDKLKDEFKELTGSDAGVYLSPLVW